jgi:hypothetical protein
MKKNIFTWVLVSVMGLFISSCSKDEPAKANFDISDAYGSYYMSFKLWVLDAGGKKTGFPSAIVDTMVLREWNGGLQFVTSSKQNAGHYFSSVRSFWVPFSQVTTKATGAAGGDLSLDVFNTTLSYKGNLYNPPADTTKNVKMVPIANGNTWSLVKPASGSAYMKINVSVDGALAGHYTIKYDSLPTTPAYELQISSAIKL